MKRAVGSRLLASGAVGLTACAAAAFAPAKALGNGDPASDVLLVQNAFYPYQPKVSGSLESALAKTLGEASRSAGLHLKVAVINKPTDLGLEPQFFGRPQAYARFLDSEISFNQPQELLVVMPAGFGVMPAGSAHALAGTQVDGQQGTDGLVRSAIAGVAALARSQGHPIAVPKVTSSSSSSSPPALLVFGVPVLLLAIGGFLAMRRVSHEHEEEADA